MGAHSEKTHIPIKGTEKRNKMPGPQLTRDDLNSLLIFENLCNDWVREVHRFTSERKKKKNFVIFRNCENKKLTSLEGLKEELDDVSFLENAEFKSAFSHDIVSNKVGANKRARKAAKAWMADPKKQVSNTAPVQEATPVEVTAPVVEEVRVPEVTPHVEESIEKSAPFVEEVMITEETPLVEELIQESAPVVEESIKVTPDDETETEPEDIKSYEEVIIPDEDTPNDITEEELAAPVEEQVIPADEQKSTDSVVEDAVSVVVEEEKAPVEAEVTPDVDAEEEASSSFEEITVPEEEQVTPASETDVIVPVIADLVAPVEEASEIADEEQVKAPVEETLVVETDADEEFSIADVKEDTNVQETSAPLEGELALPAVEEATSTVDETKESVAAPLPTEDLPSTLPEVELVITQTSEETDQIEETPSIEEKEKIEEESVPIVKAETDRGSSVLSNTSDMGSMESLEAQTDSASTNSDDDNENSCSDTDIFIPTSDEKQKNVEAEDIKIEIVQVL